jgi:phage gp36-like protein
MGYATRADIEELYGPELLVRVADYDKDGEADEDVIAKGLAGADEICNAYLSAQYSVPVVPTPGVVRTCAIDIAVYRMALQYAARTNEMRVRYEDALALLERISKGTVGLGIPPVDEDGDGVPDSDPNAKRKGRIFDIGRG